RLELRGTRITGATFAALRAHPRLEQLVLAETRLAAEFLPELAYMPGLRRVSLWSCGLAPEVVAALRASPPQGGCGAGDRGAAAVLEEEPPPVLTNGASRPGAASADAKGKPTAVPINERCPVSSKPIDRRFVVEDQGEIIGFCCEKCVALFNATPD